MAITGCGFLFAGAVHGFVEVSTPDYPPDPRQSPEQARLAGQARVFMRT